MESHDSEYIDTLMEINHYLILQTSSINKYTGFTYFLNAAECGLRVAMVIVGQVYEMGGENITSPDCDKPITQDWCDAVKWYLDAIEAPQCEVDDLATDQENYTLLAKVAYLYQTGIVSTIIIKLIMSA